MTSTPKAPATAITAIAVTGIAVTAMGMPTDVRASEKSRSRVETHDRSEANRRGARLRVLGKNLVRNFAELDALSAVVDGAPAGRELAASLAPRARITAAVADVFAADVLGVVIATPAETHYALTKAALNAGRMSSSRSRSH